MVALDSTSTRRGELRRAAGGRASGLHVDIRAPVPGGVQRGDGSRPVRDRAPDYELQACLATQLADEFRHLQCVLRVYDEVFGIRGLQR